MNASRALSDDRAERGSHRAEPNESAAYYHALDSLRFIFVVFIAAYHSEGLFGFQVRPMSTFVGTFVTYFYILSGFVLAHRYPAFPDHAGFLRYLGARFARVMPLHVLGTALVAVQKPVAELDWTILAANLLIVHTWATGREYYFSFNGPSWTLCPEMLMYVLLPLFVTLSRRPWLLIAGGLAFGSSASALAYRLTGEMSWSLLMFPPARLSDFAVGVGLYRLGSSRRKTQSSGQAIALDIFSVSLLMLAPVALSVLLPRTPEEAQSIASSFSFNLFFQRLIPIPIFGLLIYQLAFGAGPVRRFLSVMPFRRAGALSASLYLLHFPVLHLARRHGADTVFTQPAFAILLLVLVSIGFSALIHRFYEVPARRRLNGFFNRLLPEPGRFSNVVFLPQASRRSRFRIGGRLVAGAIAAGSLFAAFLPGQASRGEQETIFESVREVHFEDFVVLVDIRRVRLVNGTVVLKTRWRATGSSGPCTLAVHLLDRTGKIFRQYDHSLVRNHPAAGSEWTDAVSIHPDEYRSAARIGLAVVVEGRSLRADRGHRDWGTHRLLIDAADEPAEPRLP